MPQYPIINCHTHIFTGDHVPPYLAKTYVPPPLHCFISLQFLVRVFRWWYHGPARMRYSTLYKRVEKVFNDINGLLNKVFVLKVIAGYYLFFLALYLLFDLLNPTFSTDANFLVRIIKAILDFISPILPSISKTWLKVLMVIVIAVFFKSIRNMLLFFARLIWKVLGHLPGKKSKQMFQRYLNIGRYAFHEDQKTILSKLKAQYPVNTGFIVLPMDMDYMDAGVSKTRYRDQMKRLLEIKQMQSNEKILYPFVFADPRRMVNVEKELRFQAGDKEYFKWSLQDGRIVLEDCFLKEYLEEHRFSGIKIYPALGYYPFDEKLLPLWKYAADNNIPIMTHCIKGTIFYRGVKKTEWGCHPVFQQSMTPDKQKNDLTDEDEEDLSNSQIKKTNTTEEIYEPLVLAQHSNVNFSYNFTHPLNYLCLLDEPLLRRVIANAVAKEKDSKLAKLFGYTSINHPLEHNLSKLKICLAHFGGDDEWKRFFEKDRDDYSSQLLKRPERGIEFFLKANKSPSKGKLEKLWKYGDWYSIICSLILQYPQVYADISYILHGDLDILPLLKQTLQNPKLREKVLYGTDFFVVRNHKSDKNMLADMKGGLSEADFNQIARLNPQKYLQTTLL